MHFSKNSIFVCFSEDRFSLFIAVESFLSSVDFAISFVISWIVFSACGLSCSFSLSAAALAPCRSFWLRFSFISFKSSSVAFFRFAVVCSFCSVSSSYFFNFLIFSSCLSFSLPLDFFNDSSSLFSCARSRISKLMNEEASSALIMFSPNCSFKFSISDSAARNFPERWSLWALANFVWALPRFFSFLFLIFCSS